MIAFVALRHTRPTLWLAVYALGLLCVFSFIVFEVLDLDGSDFQSDPRRASVKPAESEQHDDVRRASLAPMIVSIVPLGAPPDDALGCRERLAVSCPRTRPPSAWRPARRLLARASLTDVPPAA